MKKILTFLVLLFIFLYPLPFTLYPIFAQPQGIDVTSVYKVKDGEAVEGDIISTAQLFYPSMQVTDIFYMNIDICQLCMDQRRANMLARDIAEKLKWKKPIAAHHHILLGLKGLQEKATEEETLIASKMSKSDPSSAIYMHDSHEEIRKKVGDAYCPPKIEEGNPILEYCKYIIFKNIKNMRIERAKRFGGMTNFGNYEELRKDYLNGKLHPQDLTF